MLSHKYLSNQSLLAWNGNFLALLPLQHSLKSLQNLNATFASIYVTQEEEEEVVEVVVEKMLDWPFHALQYEFINFDVADENFIISL